MISAASVTALYITAKNAVTTLPVAAAAAVGFSIAEIVLFIGPRGVAVLFALIGAAWRWHRFNLSVREGISGATLSMVMAFILGDGQVPWIGPIIASINPESLPMMNGFFMGLFGLLLVTGTQDFMKAYLEARRNKAEP